MTNEQERYDVYPEPGAVRAPATWEQPAVDPEPAGDPATWEQPPAAPPVAAQPGAPDLQEALRMVAEAMSAGGAITTSVSSSFTVVSSGAGHPFTVSSSGPTVITRQGDAAALAALGSIGSLVQTEVNSLNPLRDGRLRARVVASRAVTSAVVLSILGTVLAFGLLPYGLVAAGIIGLLVPVWAFVAVVIGVTRRNRRGEA